MKDELRQAVRHPGWRASITLAVLAIVVTALSGGFRTVKAKRTYPDYGVGATIDNGALALTPLRAWIADTRPGSKPNPYAAPAQYLVLQVRAQNRTDSSLAASSYLHNDVVWLRQVPGDGLKADLQLRSEGHDIAFELPPRLPVDVDLIWELPPQARPPRRLTWGVLARGHVEALYLTGEAAWMQDGPQAKIVLAVEDRRGAGAKR